MNKAIGNICLEGMEFYAHHGYFEEEQKLGNRYTVDIELTVDFTEAAHHDKLAGTVDYTKIYQLIASILANKASLLEHIAFVINSRVMENFPEVKSVSSSVAKHNPPIGGICSAARVNLTSDR